MAKTKNKKFTIDFLQVKEEYEDEISKKLIKTSYNLEPVLKSIGKLKPENRSNPYYEDEIRLEVVNIIPSIQLEDNLSGKNNLWELRFLRLQKGLIPGLTEEKGAFQEDGLEIALGDSKFLTESVSCLYDPDLCLLVIEKNKNLQASAILDFLVKLTNNKFLTLGIIPDPNKVGKINHKSEFKSIELSMAHINDINFTANFLKKAKLKSLYTIINNISSFNSSRLHLDLSINGNSKGSLSKEEIIDTVPSLLDIPYINKLQIGLKENEASKVEVIDLIDMRIKGNGNITYKKNESKKHNSVLFELKKAYNDNINQIKKLLLGS